MKKFLLFIMAFLVTLFVTLVPIVFSDLSRNTIQTFAVTAQPEYEYEVLPGIQTVRPYLYLREDSSRGSILSYDDDYQSRITTQQLTIGKTYIIEATTYYSSKIGNFTLTVFPVPECASMPRTACAEWTAEPLQISADSCSNELGKIVAGRGIRVESAWSADCPHSISRAESYAKRYTFTMAAPGKVAIHLEGRPDRDNPVQLDLTCGWHGVCYRGVSSTQGGVDIDAQAGEPVYFGLETVTSNVHIGSTLYYLTKDRCKKIEVRLFVDGDMTRPIILRYTHVVVPSVDPNSLEDNMFELPNIYGISQSAGSIAWEKIGQVAKISWVSTGKTKEQYMSITENHGKIENTDFKIYKRVVWVPVPESERDSATENVDCSIFGSHLHQEGDYAHTMLSRNVSNDNTDAGFPKRTASEDGSGCFWSDTWLFKIHSPTIIPAPSNRRMDGPRWTCPTHTLSLSASDQGGTVSPVPPAPDDPDLEYRPGINVALTASPEAGYAVQWRGDVNDSSERIVVTMDGNRTIHANFVPHGTLANLGFVSNGRELVVPFRSRHAARFELYASSGSSCRPGTSGCTLAATVTMGAAASDAKRDASFGDRPSGTYWVRGQYCASGSANASSTTGPRVATDACGAWSALFGSHTHTAPTATPDPPPPAPTYRLTVEASPSSCGNVSGTGDYPEGRKAPIRASVKTNVDCHFTGWTGDDIENASSSSTEVTMGAAPKTVTANFTMECKLTMEVTPRGAGTTRPAAGSAHTYDPCEPSVRLEADAGAGYRFDKWSGNGIARTSSNPATVAMKAGDDKTVTAKFVKEYTLTVRAFPTSCKQQVFNNNTTHDSGDTASFRVSWKANCGFVGWSSGVTDIRTRAASRISYGKIVMSSDRTVTATLVPRYTLRTSVSESACGSVTGDNTVHDSLKKVTVTVRWNAGCRFTGWSAGVRELATNHVTRRSSGEVRMNSDWSITAGLAKKTYTLSVSVTKTARGYLHGSVTRTPWKAVYAYNDRVTLTANANPGYRFVRWSGAASGTSTTARVTMNGDKTVKAHFELIPLPPCDPSVPGSCACPPSFPICGNAEDEGG